MQLELCKGSYKTDTGIRVDAKYAAIDWEKTLNRTHYAFCEDHPSFHHGGCCPNVTNLGGCSIAGKEQESGAPISTGELTIEALRNRIAKAGVRPHSRATKEDLIVLAEKYDKKLKNFSPQSGET